MPVINGGTAGCPPRVAALCWQYLNQMHDRLHPIFAGQFLSSLETLPVEDPIRRVRGPTELEIVLEGQTGRVVRMGVITTSQVAAFDVAALDAVRRAGPFGKPPQRLVGPDGNAYVQWKFESGRMACSVVNARFRLLGQDELAMTPSDPTQAASDPAPARCPALPVGAAIRNYVSTVASRRPLPLDGARKPFAGYLNTLHRRLHPHFERLLRGIAKAPPGLTASRPDLSVAIEVAIEPTQGCVVRFGVVRASGVTAFDLLALEAMQRAAPFGPAPPAVVSSDGNVYVHWEFRNDAAACSTLNARPYLLDGGPAPEAARPD